LKKAGGGGPGGRDHAVAEFITGTGRDVLKQMLQDHLDARAAAEPRLAEVAGADKVVRRRAKPGHSRLLATLSARSRSPGSPTGHPTMSNLHPADARLRCRTATTLTRCASSDPRERDRRPARSP
jgi:hypothetical protein